RNSQLGQFSFASQPVYHSGQAYTDGHGEFVINSETTGIVALATDQLPYARTFQIVDLPTSGVTIRLSRNGATVKGIVRELSTGEPVPNADVMLVPQVKMEFWAGDKIGKQQYSLISAAYAKLK